MIEISLGTLRSPTFQSAFQKLSMDENLEFAAKYAIGKISKVLQAELTDSNVAFEALVKKYADIKEDKSWSVPSEKQDDWNKEIKAWLETKITVPMKQMKVPWIQRSRLTAAEIVAVEDLFENMNPEEGPGPALKAVPKEAPSTSPAH